MPPGPSRAQRRLYRRLAGDALPGFPAHRVHVHPEGWQNFVLEVDGTYIFRFPRSAAHAKLLATEIALLPRLGSRLPVQVPVPVIVGSLPGRRGWPFMAYRRIPGVPLDWDHVGPERRTRLVRDLGPFLEALARFPAGLALRLGVPGGGPAVWRAQLETEYRHLRQHGYQVLTPRLRDSVDRLFRGYLGDRRNFRWRPTLLHREVHGGHVLVERGRVSGVIDWGYACVGDPARELAYWALHFGTRDLARLARGRWSDDDETFAERVVAYRTLIPTYHILGGLAGHDPAMVRVGRNALRRALRPSAEPGRSGGTDGRPRHQGG